MLWLKMAATSKKQSDEGQLKDQLKAVFPNVWFEGDKDYDTTKELYSLHVYRFATTKNVIIQDPWKAGKFVVLTETELQGVISSCPHLPFVLMNKVLPLNYLDDCAVRLIPGTK